MDLLTNPYVIIAIVVAVVVGNIMALKYTANAKFGLKNKQQNPEPTNKDSNKQQKDEDDDSSFL